MDITIKTTRYILKNSSQIREWGYLDDTSARDIASLIYEKAIEFERDPQEIRICHSQDTGEIYDHLDVIQLSDDELENLEEACWFSGDDIVIEASFSTLVV